MRSSNLKKKKKMINIYECRMSLTGKDTVIVIEFQFSFYSGRGVEF